MAQPPAQTAKAGFRLGIYVFKVAADFPWARKSMLASTATRSR